MAMKPSAKVPATVEEYIRACPPEVQAALRKLQEVIRKAAPEAEERISYKMPAYWQNGPLAYFAAFRGHVGFYPTPSGIEAFRKELAAYKGGKGSVQFPLDKPIPYALVRRIVRHKVAENRGK